LGKEGYWLSQQPPPHNLKLLVKGPLLLIALVYYLPYALVVSLKYEDENDELFATEADSGRPSGYKYTGFRYYKDKKAGSLVERAKLLKATKRWNSVGYIAVFDYGNEYIWQQLRYLAKDELGYRVIQPFMKSEVSETTPYWYDKPQPSLSEPTWVYWHAYYLSKDKLLDVGLNKVLR